MEIEFAIHTYGYYDAMFFVLNGLKMIMNSDFSSALIKLIATIATAYYAISGMAGIAKGAVSHFFIKIVGMVVVVNALLMPKADIFVVDRITGKQDIVRGLPYAFVLPVGTLEAIGAGITAIFEQAFARPDSKPYKDYGLIFGQRIVQEFRNTRITNPEFARNMDKFIDRCVVLEAMIGTRFTPEQIKASDDLFGLVTENAGTFRSVDFRIRGELTRLTCKQAGQNLKKYMRAEIGSLSVKYKNNEYSLAGSGGIGLSMGQSVGDRMSKILARNIEVGYRNTLGINKSAEVILRQNMMINAMKNYNNKSDLYGYTRASSIQNANNSIIGEVAKKYLPILLNIMKALIYASFIFIVPLMILSGGMAKYMNYCTIVFSLQIWPALNSILNLFIELYSNLHGTALAGGIITYGNFNDAHNLVDDIVYVASGLQMLIPWLSFTIVQGGVGGFVHLASSMSSSSAGAASIAANEVTSGSRSFDSLSLGNQTIDQKGGFKTDWNQMHQEGARQTQRADGSIHKEFAAGNDAVTSGPGINTSQGGRKFSLDSSVQTAQQKGLSDTLSAISGEEQNYNELESANTSMYADIVNQVARKQAVSNNLSNEDLSEEGKYFQEIIHDAKEIQNLEGTNWDKSLQKSIRMHAGVDASTPSLLPIKGGAGVAIEGAKSKSKTQSKSYTDTSRHLESTDSQNSFNNLVKASMNENFLKSLDIDSSYSTRISGNLEKMEQLQTSIAAKREDAAVYREAIEYSKNRGATDNQDMNHKVEDMIIKQNPDINTTGQAHDLIESNDPRADIAWNQIVDNNMSYILEQVKDGRKTIQAIADNNAQNLAGTYRDNANNTPLEDLRLMAEEQGLDPEQTRMIIDNTERYLEGNLEYRKEEAKRLSKKPQTSR